MAETTTPTTAADETAGRVKRWLIAHPGRAAAARFPIDELWTLLDERAEITAEIVKAHAAVDLLAKRAREVADERDQLERQLDAAEAAPREVWLMDNERTRIHDTELGARAAAISSWVDANPDPGYAAPFSFIAIAPDGDTDVDCVELIAMGHTTGIYVTRMPVETSEAEPGPLESAVTEARADIAADPDETPAPPAPWLLPEGDD